MHKVISPVKWFWLIPRVHQRQAWAKCQNVFWQTSNWMNVWIWADYLVCAQLWKNNNKFMKEKKNTHHPCSQKVEELFFLFKAFHLLSAIQIMHLGTETNCWSLSVLLCPLSRKYRKQDLHKNRCHWGKLFVLSTVSPPTQTPGPYKRGYQCCAIRGWEALETARVMSDENMGLWETEQSEWLVDSHPSCPRWQRYSVSGGLGQAVSRHDGWELNGEKHVDSNDSHACCTQNVSQHGDTHSMNDSATYCRSYPEIANNQTHTWS